MSILIYWRQLGQMGQIVALLILISASNGLFAQTNWVRDIDGNLYHTVRIGKQTWMLENLRVTRYRNGDSIKRVTGYQEWEKADYGAYDCLNPDCSNTDTLGLLYNMHTVFDPRGLAPKGWRVPNNMDWMQLLTYLGIDTTPEPPYAGPPIPSMSKIGPSVPPRVLILLGRNTRFKGRWAGCRMSDGRSGASGYQAFWWSSTPYNSVNGYFLYGTQAFKGERFHMNTAQAQVGMAVRCILDE